jgi:hypothetical protein
VSLVLTINDTPTVTGSVGTSTVGASQPAVHVKRPDGTVVSRTGTWTDIATGAWSLTFQTGDLNQVGDYLIEVLVTFAGGAIQTFALDPNTSREQSYYVRNEYA